MRPDGVHLEGQKIFRPVAMSRNGKGIVEMEAGDFVVFHAGLRPTKPTLNKLEYALTGQMLVRKIILAGDVAKRDTKENAHTRRAIFSP